MNDHDMRQALTSALQPLAPTFLSIDNESANHAGYYPGKASHMKIILVSDAFAGKRRVAQHQLVYRHIAPLLMANGGTLHAAALHTYTPQQWAQQAQVPASPPCAGQREA